MKGFMSFLQKIRAVWQKIGLVQRALLAAIVVTFALVGGLLVHWARRPDMRMLYQELAPEEAAQITEKINEQGIAYELRNGGTSIYVPKEKVYQLRLDLAKDGLPAGEQGGYKIFENEKIGVSPFVQSVNLKRALQEELAKSIQMIDGVAHARVHIVRSEQTLFTSEAGKTTASVVLRLKPGYRLSALNIAAITHLVSGSVEGLTSESVTVIDSQGRLLSGESDQAMAGGAGTVQDYRERVEQSLEDKVEELLTTVLGPGRAKVRVHAVVDMNSVNTITEKYEPKGVATKEEITTGSEIDAGNGTAAASSAAAGNTKKDETIVTEYQVGKTVTQEVVLPGEIMSLSVAAVVDLSAADANQTQAAGQTARIMDVNDVEKLIENALGLDLAGTDSLKVVDAKFQQPAGLLPDAELSGGLDYLAIAGQASLGIMAICALLVLRMFKGAKKKVQLKMESGAHGAGGAAGLLPGGTEVSEPLLLRRQIAHALQSNPEHVRQLFASWIEGNGG
ncbi:MAG: flagellar M-ring protein FliF [Planctomycetes bacterium RBG_16_55_9]|nr:MAG: flagellar M-ring protein FliF [Planctomycetes bacterium RBG_16_55_9]